jgi:hypothetical protein
MLPGIVTATLLEMASIAPITIQHAITLQHIALPSPCRFPFYDLMKLLVTLWMIAPQTQVGAGEP